MTEQEFRAFLEGLWKKGRVSQVSAVIDSNDVEVSSASGYIQGHALLPRDYDRIPEEKIIGMGSLLFMGEVSQESKKAILMILAHYPRETALAILAKYALKPDIGLEFFARMALEECAMWTE